MKSFDIEYQQVQFAQIFVGHKGGTLSVVSPDGEVILLQGLLPGNYPARDWQPYMEAADCLKLEGQVTALRPRQGRTNRSVYGEGSESTGANPDWRPRRESKFETEMRRVIGGLTRRLERTDHELQEERRNRRLERRAQRLEPPLVAPEEVVEDQPQVDEPPAPQE